MVCDGEKETSLNNSSSVDYTSYIGNWNASSSNENNDTTITISNVNGNNVDLNITRVIGQGMYVDDLTISGQIGSDNTLYFNSIISGGWGNICSGYIKFENGTITATVTVTPGEYGSSCDCAMTDEVFVKK